MREDVEALVFHRLHHGARDVIGRKAPRGHRFLQHRLAGQRFLRFGGGVKTGRAVAL